MCGAESSLVTKTSSTLLPTLEAKSHELGLPLPDDMPFLSFTPLSKPLMGLFCFTGSELGDLVISEALVVALRGTFATGILDPDLPPGDVVDCDPYENRFDNSLIPGELTSIFGFRVGARRFGYLSVRGVAVCDLCSDIFVDDDTRACTPGVHAGVHRLRLWRVGVLLEMFRKRDHTFSIGFHFAIDARVAHSIIVLTSSSHRG